MLLNKKIKFFKNQKGFTLIELMATMVILGVIAAIAVPSVGGIIENSKTDADIQTESLIKSAAELYLVATDPKSASGTVPIATLVSSGYLKAAPENQATGFIYATVDYTYTSTGGYVVTVVTPTA